MDADQPRRGVVEQLGEALHPLVDPSCDAVDIVDVKIPLAGSGEEAGPGPDDGDETFI